MTGINFDLKNEANKFDSYQFRYKKSCEIVKKYEVVEIGLTFYFERKDMEKEEYNSEYYSERTFTFTLLRNSRLKNILDFFTANHPDNIFNCFSTYNPDTHKFLNSSNFNFEELYKEGINYSKLSLTEKIREKIKMHLDKGKPANSIYVLSKSNEKILIDVIIEIVKFLTNKLDSNKYIINSNDNNDNNKNNKNTKKKNQNTLCQKTHKIINLSLLVINYILSLNLRKILKLSNFSISRDKENKNSIIIEKTKATLKIDDFLIKYGSLENFIQILDMNFIKKQKFSLVVNSITKDKAEDILKEEIGFSQIIQLIVDKKPRIIGHNVLFDLLFIYEKFCDFFPESFFDYCKNINHLFPKIYDTKYLIDKFFKDKDFDHTNLVYIYEKLIDDGYANYVRFIPELVVDFDNENFIPQKEAETKEEISKFHNAGFDSLITGRCFVNIMKALENNFLNMKNLGKHLAAKVKKNKPVIKINDDIDSNKTLKQVKREKNNKKEKSINDKMCIEKTQNNQTINNKENINKITNIKNNTIFNNDVKPMEIEEENKIIQHIENINDSEDINIQIDVEIKTNQNEEIIKMSSEIIKEERKEMIDKEIINNEIKIKFGWVDFDKDYIHLDTDETNEYMKQIIKSNPDIKKDKLSNKIIFRNYEYPFNVIDFGYLDILKLKEEMIINKLLKNVFIIIFKDQFIDVFQICSLIDNNEFNFSAIKIDDNKVFIEIIFDIENDIVMISHIISELRSNPNIISILDYKEFQSNNFLNVL